MAAEHGLHSHSLSRHFNSKFQGWSWTVKMSMPRSPPQRQMVHCEMAHCSKSNINPENRKVWASFLSLEVKGSKDLSFLSQNLLQDINSQALPSLWSQVGVWGGCEGTGLGVVTYRVWGQPGLHRWLAGYLGFTQWHPVSKQKYNILIENVLKACHGQRETFQWIPVPVHRKCWLCHCWDHELRCSSDFSRQLVLHNK